LITVELIYELSCPNIQDAREVLRQALKRAHLPPIWKEWEVNHADTPQNVRIYGSPTILIDGQDVAGSFEADNNACCRIYSDSQADNRGVPSISSIMKAISHATQKTGNVKSNKLNAAVVPGVGVALLPKLACPACWPAYAGFLSSLGIGFFDYTPYLIPLTLIFIVIALLSMAYKANNRRGYAPLSLGVVASIIIVVGKFYLDSDPIMYGGIAFLVAASLWNSWPRKGVINPSPSCNACH